MGQEIDKTNQIHLQDNEIITQIKNIKAHYCQQKHKKKVSFYCHKCDMFVCNSCCVEHPSHLLLSISEAMNNTFLNFSVQKVALEEIINSSKMYLSLDEFKVLLFKKIDEAYLKAAQFLKKEKEKTINWLTTGILANKLVNNHNAKIANHHIALQINSAIEEIESLLKYTSKKKAYQKYQFLSTEVCSFIDRRIDKVKSDEEIEKFVKNLSSMEFKIQESKLEGIFQLDYDLSKIIPESATVLIHSNQNNIQNALYDGYFIEGSDNQNSPSTALKENHSHHQKYRSQFDSSEAQLYDPGLILPIYQNSQNQFNLHDNISGNLNLRNQKLENLDLKLQRMKTTSAKFLENSKSLKKYLKKTS